MLFNSGLLCCADIRDNMTVALHSSPLNGFLYFMQKCVHYYVHACTACVGPLIFNEDYLS